MQENENVADPVKAPPEKKRGILLTVWLLLLLGGNFQSFAGFIQSAQIVTQVPELFEGMPPAIFYGMSMVALANMVFIIFLFRWKKWAFFALCGGYASLLFLLMFGAPGLLHVNLYGVLAGGMVITLGILYLLLRPKWQFLE